MVDLNPVKIRVSQLSFTDILGWIIPCMGGFPEHCRKFNSISGLDPLAPPFAHDNPKCLQTLLWGHFPYR